MTEIAERVQQSAIIHDSEGEIIHPGTLCLVNPTTRPPSAPSGKCLAVYCGTWGEQPWLLLTEDDSTADSGWKLGRRLSARMMDTLDLRRFDDTHRGWWPGVVTSIERALGFWCPEHRRFHAAETCPTTPPEDPSVISGLRTQLSLAQERERAAVKALEDFKAKVREVGGEYAESHDMCGVYEECMAELGLKGSEEFAFEIEVTFRTKVTTAARTKDAAEAFVLDADWHVDLDLGSDHEMDDTGVNNLDRRIVIS